MQIQSRTSDKSNRQLVYIVVGRPIDNTYTEQANVLLFTTNDREVAEAKAEEQNRSQNKYVFEVVGTELVTKQTIIEDNFIAPIIRHLQEFTRQYKFITSEDLTNAIDQLFFSEDVTKLLSNDEGTEESSKPLGLS